MVRGGAMRYTSTINNIKCIEWDLSLNQAFLMDILIIADLWAKRETINDVDYRWVSRNKVVEEIPHAYKTADRVYRSLKDLAEKGVIDYKKLGKKDLVRITEKGKEWVFHKEGFEKRMLGKNIEKDANSANKSKESDKKTEKGQDNSIYLPTYNGVEFNHGVEVNNTIVSEAKNEADSLVEFWNDNRPPQSAVKVSVWSKHIKTRLKTFTADEIRQAMLSVINSQWHQQNNQVLIKNAIDSDKRCADAIEKSQQPNSTQGNNNERPKQHNSQHNQQHDTSTTAGYAAKLDADAAAYYARQAAERAANGSY